jgi:hypothetical protein
MIRYKETTDRETQGHIHRQMFRRILLVAVERLTPEQRLGIEAYLAACKMARFRRRGRTDDEILVDALSRYLPESAPLGALNRELKKKRTPYHANASRYSSP